jgi:hypothetical protein
MGKHLAANGILRSLDPPGPIAFSEGADSWIHASLEIHIAQSVIGLVSANQKVHHHVVSYPVGHPSPDSSQSSQLHRYGSQ